jgi:hypothetical protein
VGVESAPGDGSANLRDTIERFDAGSPDASAFDSAAYISMQLAYDAYADGSHGEVRVEVGDASRGSAAPAMFLGTLPGDGLEVGQAYDAVAQFPTSLPGLGVANAPVNTRLAAVTLDQGRPAARLEQVMNPQEVHVLYTQGGYTYPGLLSGSVNSTYVAALETGWPLRVDSVTSYMLKSADGQRGEQRTDVRIEQHAVMDEQP